MVRIGLLLTGGLILFSLAIVCGCTRQGSTIPPPLGQAGLDPGLQQSQVDVDPALLAELTNELARQLAANGWRSVSAPPTGSTAASKLAFDKVTSTLAWGYYSPGDYDQNGEVNVADITPIAVHFGESGEFDADSIQAVVDGDSNGEINIADITPIAINFGATVTEYRVYASADEADYPDGGGNNGPGAQLIAVWPFELATSGADSRKQFSVNVTDPQSGNVYWVRPSDGELEGTPSNLVGEANQWPIAVLSADTLNGLAPLSVRFNGFSSGDLDGVIIKYEWDFDGEAGELDWLDTGNQVWAEHTYTGLGDYLALLRVTDNNGATDTDRVLVRVRVPIPPVARLTTVTRSGPAPFKVSWDASTSLDSDGYIERFEWDFNGDGVYDYDSGYGSSTDFYYYEPGNFIAAVRVTDNDGLSSIAEASIETTPGAEWHYETVVESGGEEYAPYYLFGFTAPLEVDGRPGLFFRLREEQYGDFGLGFIRAEDGLGTSWDSYSIIEPDHVDSSNYFSAIILQGKPAIFFRKSFIESSFYSSRHSLDSVGSDWGPSQGVPRQVEEDLVVVAGKPAYLSSTSSSGFFYRAEDALGTAWNAAVEVIPGLKKAPSSLVVVDGLPAYSFVSGGDLMYVRALDELGANWPPTPVVILTEGDDKSSTQLVDAGGHPAIAYYEPLLNSIRFIRALDPAGEEWGEPTIVILWATGSILASYHEGRPMLLYTDQLSGGIRLVVANDVEGKSWGLPVRVTSGEAEDELIFPRKLVTVNGNPAFCSFTTFPGEPFSGQIKYVSYY